MTARELILAQIRKGSARRHADRAPETRTAEQRLQQQPRGTIPRRSQLPHNGQVDLFVAEARRVGATVTRLSSVGEVPQAVAAYLAQENLPARLRMAPDPQLNDIPWAAAPTLDIQRGRAQDGDDVGLTGCLSAVAETGTLVMTSGPAHPTSLNFLPETHVVVVKTRQVTGAYEDALDIIKQQNPGGLPRTINLITGPSRTGDIEQTIYMGAHGPRRLHILLVDEV